MRLEHRGISPRIHESAYIAPNATAIGENGRVLIRAVLAAEGGPVEIGGEGVIMEDAVIRSTPRHPARLGDHNTGQA